nr:immunoglobulin light chain junction region [Macaca mulatta]
CAVWDDSLSGYIV